MSDFLYKIPTYLPTAIVLVLLFYLTLVPQPLPPIDVPMLNADKVVHMVMMWGVSSVIMFDYKRRERQRVLSLSVRFYIMVGTILLGAFIELAQGTELIHRGCDLWDGIANAVGCVLAFFITPPLLRRLL
ncbi:MAG: hypothetical protein IJE73_02460 [Muribaculaceae bacterium]|nr:hypothetical protein [Muribaculaceae bacterium]